MNFLATTDLLKESIASLGPTRRISSYLINPKRYCYPMNTTKASNTFLTLGQRKSSKKIPQATQDTISCSSQRPKSSSQLRLKIRRSINTKKEYDLCSRITTSVNNIKTSERTIVKRERVVYKPTTVRTNSRSNFTLHTSFNFRDGANIQIKLHDASISPSNKSFSFKKKHKKLRFLVPEFQKKN